MRLANRQNRLLFEGKRKNLVLNCRYLHILKKRRQEQEEKTENNRQILKRLE